MSQTTDLQVNLWHKGPQGNHKGRGPVQRQKHRLSSSSWSSYGHLTNSETILKAEESNSSNKGYLLLLLLSSLFHICMEYSYFPIFTFNFSFFILRCCTLLCSYFPITYFMIYDFSFVFETVSFLKIIKVLCCIFF